MGTAGASAAGGAGGDRLDADAYEVLRGRLGAAARELGARAGALNAARQAVFGGGEVRLAGSERVATEQPALPADIAPVAGRLLFASNPAQVTDVGDVLRLRDGDAPVPGLLDDPQFVREFRELHRYYRQTRLLRLRAAEGRLLAVFRTGPSAADVKALAWRVDEAAGTCAYEGTTRDTPAYDGGGHTVEWTPAGRETHVPGRQPHLAIGGVTVDPTGGTLTIRVGDTTYEEPVEDALQSLADAEVHFADAEPLVLLRIRPYHEEAARHFAVNTRTEQVDRIDALGQACLRLPEEQGVVFPGGYALATGGTRTFDLETAGERLEFERLVRSANGEDVLYVFHAEGRRLLLPYNLVRKEVAAPLTARGWALHDDGTLLTLRPADGDEPARVHTLQRWSTPFVSDTWAASRPAADGPLARIGNPDLVRAVSDALSVARAALETAPGAAVYEALAASCDRVLDRHHWLADIDVDTGQERTAAPGGGAWGSAPGGAFGSAPGVGGASGSAPGAAFGSAPGGVSGSAPGAGGASGSAPGAGSLAGGGAGTAAGPAVADGAAPGTAGAADSGSAPGAGGASGSAPGASSLAGGGAGTGAGSAVAGVVDSAAGADPGAGRAGGRDLAGPLLAVRDTARAVLAEYARVREATARAAAAVEEVAAYVTGLVRRVRGETRDASAAEWVEKLGELRAAQGRLATLRETRYADLARLDDLAASLTDDLADAAARAAESFADEHAFDAFRDRAADLATRAGELATAAGGDALTAELDALAAGLATVTETAGGLEISDATVRTRILASAADVLGAVNRARAVLDARRRDLLGAESAAEFAAESALLAQSVSGALAAADTPEACDLHLGRLLVQVESLTTRFAAEPERIAALAERRDEIQQTLTARRQALADERAQRAARLAASADRILDTIRRRAATLASADEVNTLFAADPLAAEHRRIGEELRALGDPAKAAELADSLAAARQDTARTLRDRTDLYEDGGATIRLGRHRFAVNTQPLDLALVPHADALAFTVTGTDYLSPVTDPAFTETRRFWHRPLVSETPTLYRAEYLAASLLLRALPGAGGAARAGGAVAGAAAGLGLGAGGTALGAGSPGGSGAVAGFGGAAAGASGDVEALVRDAVAARVDEGYQRGVHDHDAALLLAALGELASGAGLLRYPPGVRADARLYWEYGTTPASRAAWTTRARSLTRAAAFGAGAVGTDALDALGSELGGAAGEFLGSAGLPAGDADLLGEYLVAELAAEQPGFVAGAAAGEISRRFADALGGTDAVPYKDVLGDLDALGGDLAARRQLALGWLAPFAGPHGDHLEAAAALLCPGDSYPAGGPVETTVEGLLGSHPRIQQGTLTLRLDELLTRVRRFEADDVPAYRTYQRHRTAVVTAERERLGLAAYRPRPLTGFVRNRLIDEVYLPLVGDSLAKQFGSAGGLLMLLSPPGYGKTTLVEYVAARLGLALVTVSGPALGTGVTSLDPERAPDATARREVEKLVFALSLGTNVLLHLDDIQHTSAELLQKFIPLCDATRRIEGPGGTFELRGKRFAVCMSGNPYTESGTLFRVPDMLANRADVWNLGDVLGGREDVFALSYVENALTANAVLAPLAGRDRGDLAVLLRLAADDPTARADALAHPYQPDELDAVVAVLRQALRVRDVLLAVNAEYIGAVAGESEGEPFQLQGSYRDMNRLTARLHPSLTFADVDALITDHYRAEAHALASGAGAALRRLAALRG
ncbi:DNA repair ATPase [Streptomyces sp. NPDC021020]|uniref:DNA repair ATPase n=1 Tax=Streptomyces sp. NPDC021020 TaxID=3365109 RepID=UPI00379A2973